jgi:predicted DNA-binding protein (MmcQ/YjbR family)
MASNKDAGGSALERLRQFGLRYPGAHTKSPWPGHLDLAVNDKTFAYLSLAGEPLTISCKLPRSADSALSLPFTTPTAYGLGKSGWVTATFPDGAPVPVELLQEWIDESYRAQAPKRLSAGMPPLEATTTSVEPSAGRGKSPTPRSPASKAPAGKARTTKARTTKTRAAAARSRSTVKQTARASAGAPSTRSQQRRPARVGAEGSARARSTKRPSVSQRAAKRTPKKR